MYIKLIKNIFLFYFVIIGTIFSADKKLSLPKTSVEYVANTIFQVGILDKIFTFFFFTSNLSFKINQLGI